MAKSTTTNALYAMGGGEVPSQTIFRFVFRTNTGQQLDVFEQPTSNLMRCPSDLLQAQRLANGLFQKFDWDLKQSQAHLAALAQENPEVWSYWVFLYFSASTQTTVGYGDILPNSTEVKMIVVAQLVLSTALVIIGLNLVFATIT